MMIRTILVQLTLVALLFVPNTVVALRCGYNLASVGDLKFEVLRACGEPLSREVIGFIDQEVNGDRIRVMKIEEWIVEESGHYYSLIFEGNRLVHIEFAGRK